MNVMIRECDNKVLTFLLPGWSAPGPVAGQKKHPKLKTVQKIEMAFLLHSFKMSIFPCETVFVGFKPFTHPRERGLQEDDRKIETEKSVLSSLNANYSIN